MTKQTKVEHTKGPWRIEPFDLFEPNDIQPVVTACDGFLSVCEVHNHDKGSLVHTKEECLANARLIAAAPELLAALERILRAHDSKNNGAYMGEAVLCPMFAEMARDAIQKARPQ